MSANTIQWEKDADGIVTLTLDDPNGSANVMNDDYKQSMAATVKRLVEEKDSITGVVITSAKKTFFAGGDLTKIIQIQPENAQEAFNEVEEIKADLRTLETFGRPVVAAINGAALGGGLEIALATHHRIAADVKGSQIGLPEVSLGLLPGGGGRHPHPGRPQRLGQRDERRLQAVDGRGRQAPCGREGFDHRRGDHQRQEDLLRRW
ncbi:fatty oxidation protein FadB [Mycobacteroides abscessus subsp. abscessus]|nr:fatty oxidation protein FadB [Mycobacteroides abscessus subsp. abscessus]